MIDKKSTFVVGDAKRVGDNRISFSVTKIEEEKEIIKSDKSYLITLALVIFLGWCGAHDFYVGKISKGVIKLVTFNFILFGWLLDFIAVLFFAYEDSNGYSIWRMLPAKKESDGDL